MLLYEVQVYNSAFETAQKYTTDLILMFQLQQQYELSSTGMQQLLHHLSNWLLLPLFIQGDILSLVNHKHQYSQQAKICLSSCCNSDLWQRK